MSDIQNSGLGFSVSNGVDTSNFGVNPLQDLFGIVKSKLQQAASNPSIFAEVFGDKANTVEFQSVIGQWQVGVFSQLPTVQVVSAADMNGADGAYASSTQKIYLSDADFGIGAPPQDVILAIAKTLTEEIGHFLDSKVGEDTVGDEGERFASSVFDVQLSSDELSRINNENDYGFITVGGQSIAVEFSSNTFTYGGRTYQWTNYTIKSGDSLSAIAQRTLGDGSANAFNLIARQNGIPNPNIINANRVIQVPQLFNPTPSPTPTPTPTPATSPAPQTGNFTYGGRTYQWTNYTIKSGDNLSAIAQRTLGDGSANAFNLIARQNGIPNPNIISAGRVIQVPQLFNPTANPTPTPTGYYRELNTFSESQWDLESGDDNQFRPDSPFGGGNQQSKTDNRVRQIYTDLSNDIFGYRVQMTAGYAYDQSYFNGFRKWHAGLDMGASNGATIRAAIGGSVAWVSGSGDGNIFVGINSDDGRQWVYGHLKSASGLSVGRRINAGATVGVVGAQNHLHLEVQNGHAYGGTQGAMTDRNRLLNVTVSPLMAYWQWRNKGATVVNPPTNNPVVNPPTNNFPTVSSTNWKAEFFNNTNLSGSPVLIQDLGSGSQNFSRNWGYSSPSSAVSSDNFSARVTTQRYFAPGTYQIQTTSDDGVRVRIGNQTVINKWIDQGSTSHFGTFTTNGGTFNVSVEYYERGGAANLSFTANSIYSFSGSTTINGASFGWDLGQYNASGKTKLQIDPNKTTVVVAHGRVNKASDGVGNLEQLAKTAASTFGNAQVIFLDWRNASADSNTRPTEAGKRIGSVANDVAQALKNLGLTNANNLYFYGHSLGSLLLTKVAENYGKIAGFASLDPAFAAEDYDLDNDGNTWEDELPDISSIATRSISLVAEDIAVVGVAGDNNYAMTAQRAFIVDFSGYNLKSISDAPGKFHNAVVDVFTGMLRNGLEINLLATTSDILDNQWGQNASQKQWNSFGNYNADGVINARFVNNNSSLIVDDLLFLDSSKQRRTRSIGQQLSV